MREQKKEILSREPLGSFKSSFFALRQRARPPGSVRNVALAEKARRAAVNCAERSGFSEVALLSKKKKQPSPNAVPRLASLLALDPFESPENDGRDRDVCRIQGSEQKEHERGRVFLAPVGERGVEESIPTQRRPSHARLFVFSKHQDPPPRRLRLGGRFATPRAGSVMVFHVPSVRAESDNGRTCEIRGRRRLVFLFFVFFFSKKAEVEEEETGKSDNTFRTSEKKPPPSFHPLSPPRRSAPSAREQEHEPIPPHRSNRVLLFVWFPLYSLQVLFLFSSPLTSA